MSSHRYARNIALFGEAGQEKLNKCHVVVVGAGGLGSPLVQHLAFLGCGKITVIDDEYLSETNRNRLVGAKVSDPIPGTTKVSIADRLISEINQDVVIDPIDENLIHVRSFEAIKKANWVFGCFDDDGPRAVLNELSAAYSKPYSDLASDVPDSGAYGGRVFTGVGKSGCLHCHGILDPKDVRQFFAGERDLEAEAKIYGVDRGALGVTGPSVSPSNGVVASLAATEFMAAITGMRKPFSHLEYRGHLGIVTVNRDTPKPNCFICDGLRGQGEKAEVERYLSDPILERRILARRKKLD